MNYFEQLMKTPVKIYTQTSTVNDFGQKTKTLTEKWTGNCNFHSLNVEKSQFADKTGYKTVFLVCVPLSSQIGDTDLVEINSVKYEIIGIRQATIQYEYICEVVKYE